MKRLQISTAAIALLLGVGWLRPAIALPSVDDTPEEVLRTEIILEAYSPLTGEPLTAVEYAQLQEQLSSDENALLSPQIRRLIFLLQIRRAVKPIIPFIP